MIRVLLEFAVPLLLPTVLYGIWLAWARRRASTTGAAMPPGWRNAPWLVLAAIGTVLAVAAAVGSGLGRGTQDITGTYVPPRVIDGKVVPGHIEPAGRK